MLISEVFDDSDDDFNAVLDSTIIINVYIKKIVDEN